MTMAGTETSVWLLRLVLFVMGFGVAAVFMPSQAAGFATVRVTRNRMRETPDGEAARLAVILGGR